MVYYPYLDRTQLFDMLSDPLEKHDLSRDMAYQHQKERMTILLRREHARFQDPYPLEVDSLWSGEFDFTTIDRMPDRHQPEWVVEKYFDQ